MCASLALACASNRCLHGPYADITTGCGTPSARASNGDVRSTTCTQLELSRRPANLRVSSSHHSSAAMTSSSSLRHVRQHASAQSHAQPTRCSAYDRSRRSRTTPDPEKGTSHADDPDDHRDTPSSNQSHQSSSKRKTTSDNALSVELLHLQRATVLPDLGSHV